MNKYFIILLFLVQTSFAQNIVIDKAIILNNCIYNEFSTIGELMNIVVFDSSNFIICKDLSIKNTPKVTVLTSVNITYIDLPFCWDINDTTVLRTSVTSSIRLHWGG